MDNLLNLAMKGHKAIGRTRGKHAGVNQRVTRASLVMQAFDSGTSHNASHKDTQ